MDSICSTVNELEEHGYVIRERIRNAKGQLTDIQYTILEQPKPPQPGQEKPKQENPVWVIQIGKSKGRKNLNRETPTTIK